MDRTNSGRHRTAHGLDRWISGFDRGLRTLTGVHQAARPNPADDVAEADMTAQERAHVAGLMRVNHTGEVCAQALYRGQALVAKTEETRTALLEAAQEEKDHLDWCEERIDELGTHTSRLNPLFFASSYALGALTGTIGDKVSLGFVHATEEGVAIHLKEHLQKLPTDDRKSQLVLQQMLAEEERHGAHALEQGGEEFSDPVKRMMRTASQVMTKTTYWL